MNVILPLIWFLPAYLANSAATLSRFFPEVHPLDGGRTWKGKRILGDGKTVEGTLMGLLGGSVGSMIISYLAIDSFWGGMLLATGALLGDMVGSMVKRRMGMKRGEEATILDQLDFVFGAFLFYPPPPEWGVIIITLTPLLHRLANVVAHVIGVKHEPW